MSGLGSELPADFFFIVLSICSIEWPIQTAPKKENHHPLCSQKLVLLLRTPDVWFHFSMRLSGGVLLPLTTSTHFSHHPTSSCLSFGLFFSLRLFANQLQLA